MEISQILESNDNDVILINIFENIINYTDQELVENDKIWNFIEQIYKERRISRDVLYLTALSNLNSSIVYELVKYEQHLFKLLEYPGSLYDYVISKNTQWFEISIDSNKLRNIFDQKILLTVEILKLIHHTNKHLKFAPQNLQDKGIEFWEMFLSRVALLWEIVGYCQSIASSSISLEEMFVYSCQNACIKIFFIYLDKEAFINKEVTQFVQKEDKLFNPHNSKQINNFLAYQVCMTIFYTIKEIKSLSSIKNVVSTLRETLFSITDNKLIINVLENIFCILFTLTSDFRSKVNTFFCQDLEIRLILFLLKELLDETKSKGFLIINTKEYSDFLNIQKHVINALWRMELINKVKSPEKCEKKLLKYMLALPKSLIQMCLKEGDYERAYQVVQIFSLRDALSMEIDFCQKLRKLKQRLKQILRNESSQESNTNNLNKHILVGQIVKDFFTKNLIISQKEHENFIKNSEFEVLKHFSGENAFFANILDLALTQSIDFEGSEKMLHLAFEFNKMDTTICSAYNTFSRELCNMLTTEEYSKSTLSDILAFGNYSLDIAVFVKDNEICVDLVKLYNEFQENIIIDEVGVLNNNHVNHMLALKIHNICNMMAKYGEINTKYLYKLLNYLKAFSKVLYIEKNNSDIISKGKNTSFFNLLSHNRSELMGELLFERNVDPDEFEFFFGKLKLDYLYHVIGNCFPTINLHTEESLAEEELYPENDLYIPKKTILTYIQKRNWLLAFILTEIYKVEEVNVGVTEIRVKTFSNYSNLLSVKNLTEIYNKNRIVAAIQKDVNFQKLKQHVFSKMAKSENSIENTSIEVGEDIRENMSRRKRIVHLLDIVDSVSEIQMRKSRDFIDLKDTIIANLVEEWQYCSMVHNISKKHLRVGVILKNFRYWPGTWCIDLIKSELTKFDLDVYDEMEELSSWLKRIIFYEELKLVLDKSDWSETMDMCHSNKEVVLSKILSRYDVNLLQTFIILHSPTEEMLLTITETFLMGVFEKWNKYNSISNLLDNLPFQHAIKLCYSFLNQLKEISQLEFVISYLVANVSNDDDLKKIVISLKILKEFPSAEQEQLLGLIHNPMNIVEVLIMNMKFDHLCVAIKTLRSEIFHDEFSDNSISNEKIDSLLRKYADKSLDFRVISHPNPRLLRTPECKLMQSLDSLSLVNDLQKQFIMPDEVPNKEDWVSNDEVVDCMCCQKTAFSMFNRRHHCRRCGRVVCYYCSNNRMLVPKYGDILVRVCNDCHHQTLGDRSTVGLNDSITSTQSATNDFWLLTGDNDLDEIIRDEFSYEDAPSISLCLSIMKFHRKTSEYPRLLLDQCGVLLQLLQINRGNSEEIDYFLVIKMLKHLATAAKMAAVECTEHFGISAADRILSQADSLNLLVERGCLNLLPMTSSNFSQTSYIDSSILRRLCDKLLEREQWNLALEVSTKAGLDRTGVFSAWGKSCLRAGNLLMAREIFQRCWDKSGCNESMSDLSIASDDSLRKSISVSKSPSQIGYETKTSKNPTLLKEIVNILESNMKLLRPNPKDPIQKQLGSSMFTLNNPETDNAVYIFNKMKSLKNITDGNYNDTEDKPQLQSFSRKPSSNIFYNECVFYLGKYGSHMNLLEFLVKNGNVYEALKYIVENQLHTDIFIQVYLICLKDGLIGIVQGYILTIDSSFEIWKDYLRNLCRHLVKQNMLNSLYQLQQFMGDHVRAAMTCIKFYQENVNTFSDLNANSKYLIKARRHLNDLLEQDQWVEVSPLHRLSTSSETFEEKSVNNSSLIMKMGLEDIKKHINTISRQDDLVKFLSEREKLDPLLVQNILDSSQIEGQEDFTSRKQLSSKIPTLFGTIAEKNKLAVLAILIGDEIEDSFKIGQTIIEEFNLRPINVYCEAGKILAKFEKYNGISQLVSAIKQLGTSSDIVNNMCDEMLTSAVATLTKANCSETKVENLIKLMTDRATKISAYIEAKQLKTAYFLAVKYKRTSDIKRIMKEAELLNQPKIKILCQKVLQSQNNQPQSKK